MPSPSAAVLERVMTALPEGRGEGLAISPEAKREWMTLAVIGHVDAGKSTTTGHLLHLCNGLGDAAPPAAAPVAAASPAPGTARGPPGAAVGPAPPSPPPHPPPPAARPPPSPSPPGIAEERTLQKLQRAAALEGKGSAAFAWATDVLPLERELGRTVDVSVRRFHTPRREFTVVDTPGHGDYLKNTVTGLSGADAALLVLDARHGAYEAGLGPAGRTREHALLAWTAGVRQLVVAVNKMDDVGWSAERFVEVKESATPFLRRCGFLPGNVQFVPVSGWTGEGLAGPGPAAWYDGPSLAGALDALWVPPRDAGAPLRMPVLAAHRVEGAGAVAVGRVEAGTVRVGQAVALAPGGAVAVVQSLQSHGEGVPEARAGRVVGLSLRGVDPALLRRGMVASDPDRDPAGEVGAFLAQLVVLAHPGRIARGYCPVLDVHTAHVPCRVEDILRTVDRATGAPLEERPAHVRSGDVCLVRLAPLGPLSLEPVARLAPLGRFAVRDLRTVVAVGAVVKVESYRTPASGPRVYTPNGNGKRARG